jgi:hypothetical protein
MWFETLQAACECLQIHVHWTQLSSTAVTAGCRHLHQDAVPQTAPSELDEINLLAQTATIEIVPPPEPAAVPSPESVISDIPPGGTALPACLTSRHAFEFFDHNCAAKKGRYDDPCTSTVAIPNSNSASWWLP